MTVRPWVTLLVCALITAASATYTALRLEFRSDRSELIDPELPWQQRYAEFKRLCPRWDDAVVAIDLGETVESRAHAEAFIAALETRLSGDPRFRAVTAGVARERTPRALILTEPLARVEQTVAELSRVGPVVASPGLDGLLSLSTLGGNLGDAERDGLAGLLERAASAARGEREDVLGMDRSRGVERLVSGSGRLAFVLVSIARNGPSGVEGATDTASAVNNLASGISALRESIGAVRASDSTLARVRAGVTGVPVLESDETAQSQRDATLAGMLSLGLITLLMLIAYRGVVVPLLAVAALLLGMVWSFGWATLAVGHLQLLSVTFASLLLGLGIDVAIHIIARLELVHPDHEHLGDALAQAFRGVGPGIVTASATVAAAAGAMSLTSFSGVAEMGLIAAGGIVLCTLAIMCALPAMFMLMPRPEKRLRAHDGGVARPFMGSAGVAFHRRPALVLMGAGVALAAAAWLSRGVVYDTDLQKLMPTGTESVDWQNAIERDDQKSVWHAVVMARDEREAAALCARLRALPEVSDVAGAGMLFRPDEEIAAKREVLARLPDVSSMLAAPAPPPSAGQAESLRRAAARISAKWLGKDDRLAAAASDVAALNDDDADRALQRYRADRSALLETIAELRDAKPISPSQLPDELKALMIGTDGSLLLRIYPKDPGTGQSVLTPARLNVFVPAVLAVAPQATGPAVQIYESTSLITAAYRQAALYAFLAIVALLVLDFGVRRGGVLDVICALLPVGMGVVAMLAVMRLFGVPLNFANMIVMPLIIGIGVGCGVHAVRRWRLQPADEPPGLAGGSGRAITLTTLTTVIGFAAMMTGEHRGIWSLGFVMSVGLTMVWAATILVLPGVLRLRTPGTHGEGDPPCTPTAAVPSWQRANSLPITRS